MRFILLLIALAAVAALAQPLGIGWQKDGSAVFADQNPPRAWDAATGKGIRWKTRLPNWSNSSPIIADGRVYLMSEPRTGTPELLCIDAETGELLWTRAVDRLSLLPEPEQTTARTQWGEVYDWAHQCLQHIAGVGARDEAAVKALGFLGTSDIRAGGEKMVKIDPNHPMMKQMVALRKYGACFSLWGPGVAGDGRNASAIAGIWEGMAYPTPVSDGAHVWVITAHNLAACYDHDGNLTWMRLFEVPAVIARDIPGAGNFSTAPLLLDGVLISNAGRYLRGIDAATGRTVWEHSETLGKDARGRPGYSGEYQIDQNMASPRLAKLGDTWVIFDINGAAFNPKDGTPLGKIPGTMNGKMEFAGPLIDGDVAYSLDGDWRARILKGYRLKLGDDGKLAAEELWAKPSRDLPRGFGMWRTVAMNGRLYHAGAVLDGMTGAPVAPAARGAGAGYCWWMGLAVKDAFLSIDAEKGNFCFTDLNTGKVLATASLPTNPLPERGEEIAGFTGRSKWGILGAGLPFVYKDRLYVRTCDYLYCIGE